MENNTITGSVWQAGKKTLVLTIPKAIIQLQNIKKGDIIQATIQKLGQEKPASQKQEPIRQTLPLRNIQIKTRI